MSVVINSNYAATAATNNLSVSNTAFEKSLNRLSSGSRIVSPADDAGGLAVSMKLSATARRQDATAKNLENAISFLQTQDGALAVAGKVLSRIGELKALHGDPTKNSTDLADYDTEFRQLQAELAAIGGERFNGRSLFGSGMLDVNTNGDADGPTMVIGPTSLFQDILFADDFADLENWHRESVFGEVSVSDNTAHLGQVGSTSAAITTNQSFSVPVEINLDYRRNRPSGVEFFDVGCGGAGAGGATLYSWDTAVHHLRIVEIPGLTMTQNYEDGSPSINANYQLGQIRLSGFVDIQNFYVTSVSQSPLAQLTSISSLAQVDPSVVDSALQRIATYRAQNGANQSRLNSAAELLTVNRANLEAANSRITDVDVAQESTTLARLKVLVDAGTAMLSQANLASQNILKLVAA